MAAQRSQRILVVDDNPAIHGDFQKVLTPASSSELESLRASLFDEAALARGQPAFELASAYQGEAALVQVQAALAEERPFVLAFVDMRMPPGWDGLRTIRELWDADPRLQVVICTAYADQPWEEIAREIGTSDRLLIVKKPFDGVEIRQLAATLVEKWHLARRVEAQLGELESEVSAKTAALARTNGELSRKLAELEAAERRAREQAQALELANRSLEEAMRAAGAAAQAKGEFLSNVTHELRTPIAAILGYAELLADPQRPEEEIAQHVATIQRNGEHLLELINGVLDLSKMEAGAMTVERLACSPIALAREVGELMSLRAREKGLEFEVRFEGLLPEIVLCDPLRLRQILINLVGNAIKFTERGYVRLSVRRARTTRSQEQRLEFEVADSGIGLSPDQMQQLFQPFAQGDGSTARRFGGTGLGLSISQKLAKLLGGAIRCTSERGKGSVFIATIAVGEARAPESPELPESQRTPGAPAPAPSASPGEQRPLSGKKILLAEDGRDNQRLLQIFLTRAGAELDIAGDGREAIEKGSPAPSASRPYDLILLDMQMPLVDGLQAAAELRRSGFSGPIVALTANAFPGDRERCLAAGCSDYLTKPIGRTRLIGVCARALGIAAPFGDAERAPGRGRA